MPAASVIAPLRPLAPLFLGALLSAGLAATAAGEVPSFVSEPLHAPNEAPVSRVGETREADVVILDGGLEQGLRLGHACRVLRRGETIGEIVVIEARSHRSAALIVDLSENKSIQKGDRARVKTRQSS